MPKPVRWNVRSAKPTIAAGSFASASLAVGDHVYSAVRQDPDFAERLREWVGWIADHLWPF